MASPRLYGDLVRKREGNLNKGIPPDFFGERTSQALPFFLGAEEGRSYFTNRTKPDPGSFIRNGFSGVIDELLIKQAAKLLATTNRNRFSSFFSLPFYSNHIKKTVPSFSVSVFSITSSTLQKI